MNEQIVQIADLDGSKDYIAVMKIRNNLSPEMEIVDIEQGSPEWLAIRKTKITATDAPIIMGVSHWKTKVQLYHEKISEDVSFFQNERMRRGQELEPLARDLFEVKTGIEMHPKVVIRDWAMASLDGMSGNGNFIVEIKCPGDKDHAIALLGKVPDHYYPQIQHQLYVTGLQMAYYFSFDGVDGINVKVLRDEKYIEKMIEEEKKFYACLTNRLPPEASENDYVEKEDEEWFELAEKWKWYNKTLSDLEKEQEKVKEKLIELTGGYNSKGNGVSLCQYKRKGNVDYSAIPELKAIDLESYRKAATNVWRISS